ncbi:MAG TPA: hypothetical protein VF771_02365 [Longimicrobiaceae bacterium]
MEHEVSAGERAADRPGMAMLWSRVAKVLAAGVLVAGGVWAVQARLDGAATMRYSNPEYLYDVRLPRGLRIETSTAPNPDHGFSAPLPAGAMAWVKAEYETENANTLAEEVQLARERWREGGCTATGERASTLGGVPAAELTFRCAPASGPPDTVKLLLTLRNPPDRGVIVYQVGLQHPQGVRAPDTERVYRDLIAGFSFTGSR